MQKNDWKTKEITVEVRDSFTLESIQTAKKI